MTDPDFVREQQYAQMRLAGILAIAADAIIATDAAQMITLFNKGAQEIFGYSEAEALGQPLGMLLPERFRAGHVNHVKTFGASSVSAKQMGERREIFARRKSGEEFPAEASIAKLAVGAEQTYNVVLRDVSRRKADEAALRHSEERIRLAVDEGRIGLFEHDHGTGQSYWSPIYRELFGISAQCAASAGSYRDRIHPDDRAEVDRAVAMAVAPEGDGVFNIDHRIVWPDGSVRWVSVNSRTVFSDDSGQRRMARTIGAVRDITDQKALEVHLESRVAERTAELSAVLDAVPDAIVTADTHHILRSANATLTTLFGYGRDEIVGMNSSALYATPKDVEDIEAAWSIWEGGGVKRSVTVGCRRKDGTTFTALVLGSAVRDATGTVMSRVAFVRDMTDELMRQNLVVQAQRMEALGQLTGGIAHDSNNLLTVITGNLEMIEDELGDHGAVKYLREAQGAAQMSARLNQRLLTFARRRRLEPQVVNLNDQVLAMSELLRRTIGETIKLSTILAHDLGSTRVDPSEVENAILNLAINSRDAMPYGGNLRIETMDVTVDRDFARIEKGIQEGDYVRVTVSDTGIGMTPQVLARVFEPFFTTKEQGKGTGLGLATIFGFVKQSNGHVSITSEVGQGTTIRLYLPRLPSTPGQKAVGRSGEALALARGETILVVEDNPQVRTLTLERLRRLGYQVLEAHNGPAALDVLENATADLVFSDVVMPGGLSGFELARAIIQRNRQQRVLLTSGFAEDMVRASEGLVGEYEILRKPYTLSDLATAIRRALDKSMSA